MTKAQVEKELCATFAEWWDLLGNVQRDWTRDRDPEAFETMRGSMLAAFDAGIRFGTGKSESLAAENERLREALEWYANADMWAEGKPSGKWLVPHVPANADKGKRARAALAKKEEDPK